MAKQTDTQITGTFGDFIYYERNGKYYKRAKGNTGRQADIAKKQSALLGKASAISAKIRAAVKPMIEQPGNRQLMYRLNRSLQQWLRTEQHHTSDKIDCINYLNGFSFAASDDANDFGVAMPVIRTQDGNIALQIPTFDSPNPIHPLPFNGKIKLGVIAISIKVDDPSDINHHEEILDINYYGEPIPGKDLQLPVQTRPGYLTIVALSVNDLTSGIVGSLYN